jgi:hypothetical protein
LEGYSAEEESRAFNGHCAMRQTLSFSMHDRGEKPHRLRLLSGWTRQFFMKFRGRNAHPNRVEKPSKWTWAGWRIPEIAERLAGI